ncbi:MAG TPA: hypothetical protein VEK06_05180, partial [Myxococcota bacterium]|nr:hypothetical protein [Myxococcota bacterium]
MNCISVFIAIFMTFSAYAQNVSSTKKVPEIQAKEKAKITAEAQAKEKAKITAEINKIADLIQKNYNTTSSATFSFEQSYKHAFMATNESSKGKVYFKAQNMLWRYTEPADRQKEFYIAGKKFTYHLINDRLAYTHECFEKDTLSASITFLWGKGKLRESFVIEPYAGKTPNDALK